MQALVPKSGTIIVFFVMSVEIHEISSTISAPEPLRKVILKYNGKAELTIVEE